jgi:hypothetical protein
MTLFIYLLTGSHYVAEAGLQLELLLPQPLECWDYSYYHAWLFFLYVCVWKNCSYLQHIR